MADLDCFGPFRAQILDAILHAARAYLTAGSVRTVADQPRLDKRLERGSRESRRRVGVSCIKRADPGIDWEE